MPLGAARDAVIAIQAQVIGALAAENYRGSQPRHQVPLLLTSRVSLVGHEPQACST